MCDRTMGRVDTRIPDDEEQLLDKIAEPENHSSLSELVREAVRRLISIKIEREEMKEVRERMREVESGKVETVGDEEVMDKAGLE